ncbi:reverse transcriptase domain-containing protein [Tanacetum coccineum]
MDDEPMWAADHVVAPTSSSAITIPETANEFAIKGNHFTLVKGNQFDGRTKTDPQQTTFMNSSESCDKFNTETPKMKPMDAMTLKMDAQYKELQSNAKKTKPDLDEDDIPMSREEEHSYSNDDTCFSIDVIDEILEEDFDALLNEAMTTDENSNSEFDTEELPFEKITINTDYKIKTSLEEPPTDLELKPLPDNLEYVFLEEPSFLPVIISSQLSQEKKNKLVSVLKKHKQAFAWENKRYSWRMPFGLCNAPATYQRCMLAIFHDMIEESVKVFMDDFSVFGNSFNTCLNNLDKMLQRCKDAHLVLN